MNQSSYSPDTFGTYLSNPDRKVSGIDLSSASVLDETGNCYSTIKLYCNQLKAAMSWASKHGCLLSQTFNVYEVPRYFKSRVALSQDEISAYIDADYRRRVQ